jgi:phage/plasmid-like protein (TIGR03299 family)
MPAGLYEHDSLMSVRAVPWHGLGVVLDKHPQTIDEAIFAAGLDWEVYQSPVHMLGTVEPVEIPGWVANVRSDTEEVLGMVTKRYTPVQNREAFSFLASVFGSELHFETAGSLMNGRRVWVLMKIPSWIEVGGDPIGQYAFISNSHDGKSSVLSAVTPIRIVCENTAGAALRLAKGVHANRTYTIRHLGNMSQKISEARNVMQVTVAYYDQFKKLGDKLALHSMSDKAALSYLNELIPIDDSMKERAARNRQEAREAVMHLFKNGTEVEGVNTLGNSPGTAWGFYNAATEYADWFRNERKDGGRFQRAIDDPDGFKGKAWEISLSAAELS